ncbi:MAG: hypothetical protein R6X34_20715, partial [Chloroflexota bacterium]
QVRHRFEDHMNKKLEIEEHEEEEAEQRTEPVSRYRNFILGNNRMTKNHVRIFDQGRHSVQ